MSYGPPPEVMAGGGAVRIDARPTIATGRSKGLPDLVSAVEAKLARENGIAVRPASRVLVTAGGQSGVRQCRPRGHRSRRRSHPAGAVLLQSRDGGRDCRRRSGRRADRRASISSTWTRLPRQSRARTRAIVTVSPNNPTGAVYPEAGAARGQRSCAAIAGSSTSTTRPTSTSPTRRRGISRRARSPDAAGHTISLYSLSKAYGMASWRVGYMVVPAGAGRGDQQDSGHAADLPAGGVAVRGARGAARSAPPIRAATWRSWMRCATRSSRR